MDQKEASVTPEITTPIVLPQAVKKRKRRAGHQLARGLLIVLALFSMLLTLLPWGRAAIKTAFLLPALIGDSEPATLLTLGEPIRFTRSELPSPNGSIFWDTYEPTTAPSLYPGKHAALINIVGVGDNRNAKQLVNLSRAFAHEGIVVVNIGTPALFDFQVLPQDSEAVVNSFEKLASRPDIDPAHIGIIGFSAGGTLACLAATDPRIKEKLAFITLFGSYFDATSLLQTMGERSIMVDGHRQSWQPYYVPLQVLANAFSDQLTSDENASFQQAFSQNGTALSTEEVQSLSPPVRAAYHLLAGDVPDQAIQNMAALTPAMKERLKQLSPSSIASHIETPIYLLHDRSDQYVPFVQSRAFATLLVHEGHSYDAAEFGIFEHVEIRADNGLPQLLGDGTQLFRIVQKMLSIAS